MARVGAHGVVLSPYPGVTQQGAPGGSFESQSEAFGLLGRIGLLEVGVQWREGIGEPARWHRLWPWPALATLPMLASILKPSK